MTDIQIDHPSDKREGNREDRKTIGIVAPSELASALDVKLETLETWRKKGLGPRFARLGRSIFYPIADVLDWIEKNTFWPGTEPAPAPSEEYHLKSPGE